MASSQVDIAASSNPFGCILRDHNRRDGCRESSVRTPQTNTNLKDLVRTRVRTRTPDNLSKFTATTNDNIDSWIKERNKETEANNHKHSSHVLDRLSAEPQRAPEEVATESMSPPSITSSPSSSPQKPPNRGAAASSLVQIWEARLGRSAAPSMASNNSCRGDSPPRYNDIPSFNDEALPNSETLRELETRRMNNHDEPTPLQGPGSPFGGQQTIDNPRVADIIRRFVSGSGRNSNKNLSKVNEKNESPPLRERDSNRDYDSSGTNYSDQKSSHQGGRSLESNRAEQRLFVYGGAHSTDDVSKGSDIVEQRRLNISHCPRIRGRQAFKELLLLMERDRKKELDNLGERKPVSRFTHKGRIQSLLKLKILQRGLALQNQWRPYTGSTLQPHNSSHVSTSTNWREKNAAAMDKVIKAKPDAASSSISDSKPNNSPINGENNNLCESKQYIDEEKNNPIAPHSESSANQTQVEDVCGETSLTSNARNQDTGSFVLQDSSCSATIEVPIPDKEVRTNETVEFPAEGRVAEAPSETIFQDANGGGADSVGVPESVESCYGWYQEWTQLEGHEDDQNQDETLEGEDEDDEEDGYEWFLGVSRPRSYWENLRQSWYREVLETDSTNADIKQLLERRTVSNFLTTSEFQDRMNNMMMTHLEEQNHRLNEEEDDHSAMGNLETMRRFLSSYLQQQSQTRQIDSDRTGEEHEEEGREEEEEALEEQEIQEEEQSEVDDDEEEEEDEEMFMRRQERMEEVMSNCLQVNSQDLEEESEDDEDDEGDVIDENEYVREDHDDGTVEGDSDGSLTAWRHNDTRVPSPLMMRSWSCRYNPASIDREIKSFMYPHNALTTRAYYQNNWHQFGSVNRISPEMEMINELRAEMKELFQEMSELRRTISSCVGMQVKLQDSINQEISSVRVEQNRSDERAPRKGYCCICYDKKVDSLLYRCGHMCTCLKCAHELQMGSGKCPICRAPIFDVVRAYSDS